MKSIIIAGGVAAVAVSTGAAVIGAGRRRRAVAGAVGTAVSAICLDNIITAVGSAVAELVAHTVIAFGASRGQQFSVAEIRFGLNGRRRPETCQTNQ